MPIENPFCISILFLLLIVTTWHEVVNWLRNRNFSHGPGYRKNGTVRLIASRFYPTIDPVFPFAGLTFLAVLALVLAGVLISGVGIFFQFQNIRTDYLLRSQGVAGTAVITDKKFDSTNKECRYYLFYIFAAPGSDPHPMPIAREECVSEALYEQTGVGETVAVIYASGDPEVVHLSAHYFPGRIDFFPSIFGIWTGGMCWLGALWAADSFYWGFRLIREGVRCRVPVVECYIYRERIWTRGRGADPVDHHYLVHPIPGLGVVKHEVCRWRYNRTRVGDTLRICYLPEDPRIYRAEF